MRDHATIVRSAGSVEEVAATTGTTEPAVRSWIWRNRIPAYLYPAFIDAGWSTLEELVASAPPRKARVAA